VKSGMKVNLQLSTSHDGWSVISRGIPTMGLNTQTKSFNASYHFYVSYCQNIFHKYVHTKVLFPYITSQMY
jgi:hypothetical protein